MCEGAIVLAARGPRQCGDCREVGTEQTERGTPETVLAEGMAGLQEAGAVGNLVCQRRTWRALWRRRCNLPTVVLAGPAGQWLDMPGVESSVQRVWFQNEIKPHVVALQAVSRPSSSASSGIDRRISESSRHAVVLAAMRKPCQAWTNQPGLPLGQERGTPHAYDSDTQVCLFAALNYLEGKSSPRSRRPSPPGWEVSAANRPRSLPR